MGFHKLCINPSDSYSAEQLEFYSAEFATKDVGSIKRSLKKSPMLNLIGGIRQ